MNVSLTPRLERLVNAKVTSGLYNSASEVVREGLRLLEEQDALKKQRIRELRQEIALGLADARQGGLQPLNLKAVKAEVRRQSPLKRKA